MILFAFALLVAAGTLAVLAVTAARDRRHRRLAAGRPFFDQQPDPDFSEAIFTCTGRSPVDIEETA